jgi:hypothetical protein
MGLNEKISLFASPRSPEGERWVIDSHSFVIEGWE